MDALQTIQPRAAGMDPYELKKEFRGQIALHGAIDVQGWLQRATTAEIETEVNRLMDEVGRGGGFILAPTHNIQPDVPLENVLAVYRTVAKRRGVAEGRRGEGVRGRGVKGEGGRGKGEKRRARNAKSV